jgi:uncharacterized membrane protein YoaK (UPF0700 family)
VSGDDGRAGPRARATTLLLAGTAGSLDVLAFLALGQVFATVMTGNLVLLGIALGQRSADLAIAAGLAFAGYTTGTLAGSALARAGRGPGLRRALGLEALLLAGLLLGWELANGTPSGGPRDVLLAVAAAASGAQSAAAVRLPDVPTTTYFTGTLTELIADAVHEHRFRGWSLARIVSLAATAGATAYLLPRAPRAAAAIPLAAVLAALAISGRGAGEATDREV